MELNKAVFAHCLNNGQTMRSIVATDVLREYSAAVELVRQRAERNNQLSNEQVE